LSEDELARLQESLFKEPGKGDLIPGGNGLRKLRWKASGRGKRGGCRIIYYWFKDDEQIYLIFLYKKADKDDLTKQQLKLLSEIIKDIK